MQFGHTGNVRERLLQPLTQGLRSAQSDLLGAVSNFRQGAGPSRTYESIGGQGILDTASTPGQPLDPGRNLVNARYQGPSGLDTGLVGSALGTANTLQPVASGLGTPQDLPTLLGLAVPGLTPGQAKFESQILQNDSGFLDNLNRARGQLSTLAPAVTSARDQASSFAQQRVGEESDISRQATDYLTQQTGDLQSGLQDLVNQRLAHQMSARGMFDQFQATNPDLTNADEIPGVTDIFDLLNLEDTRQLDEFGQPLDQSDITASPLRLRRNESLNALQGLIDRFPGSVGTTANVNIQPQARHPKDESWFRRAAMGATGIPNQLTNSILRADAGPALSGYKTIDPEGVETQGADQFTAELLRLFGPGGLPGWPPRGEFANVLPAFGQDDYDPYHPTDNPTGAVGAPDMGWEDLTPVDLTDVRPFLGFQEGVTPTLGNASTEEQRARYAQQQALLGLSDNLPAPLVDYRDPAFTYNVGGLHQADQDTLNQRTTDLANLENYIAIATALSNNPTFASRTPFLTLNTTLPGAPPFEAGPIPPPTPPAPPPEWYGEGRAPRVSSATTSRAMSNADITRASRVSGTRKRGR